MRLYTTRIPPFTFQSFTFPATRPLTPSLPRAGETMRRVGFNFSTFQPHLLTTIFCECVCWRMIYTPCGRLRLKRSTCSAIGTPLIV